MNSIFRTRRVKQNQTYSEYKGMKIRLDTWGSLGLVNKGFGVANWKIFSFFKTYFRLFLDAFRVLFAWFIYRKSILDKRPKSTEDVTQSINKPKMETCQFFANFYYTLFGTL